MADSSHVHTGPPTKLAVPFVRQSSGLVKLGTPWRIFVLNISLFGIGTYMAFYFYLGPGAFPNMQLFLGIALAGLGNVIFNAAYALLAAAYPRSGGEYVYISRVLHPALGFSGNFLAAVAYTFLTGVAGFWVCTLVVSPVLLAYGGVTQNATVSSLGNWFADSNHAWLVGGILILLSALLVAFGMKVYYRYQEINFWIAAACFVVFILVFGFSSHGDFVNGINRYGEFNGNIHNAYETVLSSAQKAGLGSYQFSLWQTLGMLPILFIITPTGYVGGEVRTPLRTQFIGMVGSTVVFVGLTVLIGLFIAHSVGLDWNRAASSLYVNSPSQYPFAVAPVYTWYSFLVTTNPLLLIIMGAGFVIFGYIWIPMAMLVASRMIFAWSFDRLIPARIANVSTRYNSPIVAVAIIALAGEVGLALYAHGYLVYLATLALLGIPAILTSVTGVVFPYVRRAQFEASEARFRVAGVPLVSLLCAFSLVFWAITLYIAFTTPALGINTPSMLIFLAVCYALPLIYYFVAHRIQLNRGIDLNLAFAQLPPD